MVPNHGAGRVTWVRLGYPSSGTFKPRDVAVSPVTEPVAAIGSWFNLSLGESTGAALTAKIHGDNLYAYMNTGKAPEETGCCADTMRIFPRGGGAYTDIDLDGAIQGAFKATAKTSWAHASHTFDLAEIDGEVVALCMVLYEESALGNDKTDAIAAVSMRTGALKATADGDQYFDLLRKAGTTLAGEVNSRFKLQFVPGGIGGQQWHGNGMLRFKALDGTVVLAITERAGSEAIIMKDPYTYTSAQGSGQILQRFGTPPQYGPRGRWNHVRHFGMTDDTMAGGCHNVWYSRYGTSRETLTMFLNGVSSDSESHVYEFDLKWAKEESENTDDSVFDTKFVKGKFSWSAPAQGGARPLGEDVWIGASGGARVGYEIVDASGDAPQVISYTEANLYDPFVRIVVSGREEELVVV